MSASYVMFFCGVWFVLSIREASSHCLQNGNGSGLPMFKDNSHGDAMNRITRHRQVIVHNFKFKCCGNITEWGADVYPSANNQQNKYTIDFQVWRPSPTVDDSTDTSQYSLVRNNRFTSISLSDYIARVTPSPQDYIQFQPGDVLGFYVESAKGQNDGIVLNTTGEFSNEFVWQASVTPSMATSQSLYSVGMKGVLNTSIKGAPVIYINDQNTYPCASSQAEIRGPVVTKVATLPPRNTESDVSDSMPLQSGLVAGIVVAVIALFISAGIVVPLVLIIVTLRLKLNASDRDRDAEQDGMDNKVYDAKSCPGPQNFTESYADKIELTNLNAGGGDDPRIDLTYEEINSPEDDETENTVYMGIVTEPSSETATSLYEVTDLYYEPEVSGGRSSDGKDVFDSAGIFVPTAEVRKTWNSGPEVNLSENTTYNRLKFFQNEEVYWAPASTTFDLYAQLASKKYREISRNQLKLLEPLGSGEFGQVCKAVWSISGATKELAVKTLRAELSEEEKVRFLQEAAIMGQFSHPNVVKLYGVVTVGDPLMMCIELMTNGDLRTYLCSINPVQQDHKKLERKFLNFSQQIASGMNYLSKKSFVHRDLAARNILLDDALTCKIGDFGLARDLMDETYYTPKTKGGKIPVKWTAPEALFYKKYSTDSDVWSYGMVLFEIWSVGKKPFSQLTNNQVVKLLRTGHCQPPPPGCPRAIYKLMVDCWSPDHHQRPSFEGICAYLQQLIKEKNILDSDDGNILGAELEVGAQLYSDLQNTYLKTVFK